VPTNFKSDKYDELNVVFRFGLVPLIKLVSVFENLTKLSKILVKFKLFKEELDVVKNSYPPNLFLKKIEKSSVLSSL